MVSSFCFPKSDFKRLSKSLRPNLQSMTLWNWIYVRYVCIYIYIYVYMYVYINDIWYNIWIPWMSINEEPPNEIHEEWQIKKRAMEFRNFVRVGGSVLARNHKKLWILQTSGAEQTQHFPITDVESFTRNWTCFKKKYSRIYYYRERNMVYINIS